MQTANEAFLRQQGVGGAEVGRAEQSKHKKKFDVCFCWKQTMETKQRMSSVAAVCSVASYYEYR